MKHKWRARPGIVCTDCGAALELTMDSHGQCPGRATAEAKPKNYGSLEEQIHAEGEALVPAYEAARAAASPQPRTEHRAGCDCEACEAYELGVAEGRRRAFPQSAGLPSDFGLEAFRLGRGLFSWLKNYRTCRDCDGKPATREGLVVHEEDCAQREDMAAWVAFVEKHHPAVLALGASPAPRSSNPQPGCTPAGCVAPIADGKCPCFVLGTGSAQTHEACADHIFAAQHANNQAADLATAYDGLRKSARALANNRSVRDIITSLSSCALSCSGGGGPYAKPLKEIEALVKAVLAAPASPCARPDDSPESG